MIASPHIFVSLTLLASLGDASKTFSMRMYRRDRSVMVKRDTLPVAVGNAQIQDGLGLYYVNATVGTPPQEVQLQIDTGSSDVWFFGPNSCDSSTSPCVGGVFDPSQSTSLTSLGPGEFSITYVTPNSGVTGDYIGDDFAIGGVTISNLTMAVATKAQSVPTGIMGIGFDTDESLVSSGNQPYPNIIDVMVTENIINSRAYSLYLDDLTDSSGIVLFGGYDTEKYKGELTVLPIQPDAQSGQIDSMTVAWTSLSLTDGSGTTAVNAGDFPIATVLDSGTTVTIVPADMFAELADYFGAGTDPTYGTLVPCSISSMTGTLDFGFGGEGGGTISVGFKEFALPISDENGNPLTFDDGSTACSFGLDSADENTPVLFGDTFLRSAYVVYDLDNQQIGIAQTNFESTNSNIQEIGSGAGNVGGASSVASSVKVTQTATGKQPLTYIPSQSATASRVQATHSSVQLGETLSSAHGTATQTSTSTSQPTKNAAPGLSTPFNRAGVTFMGCTLGMMLLGGALVVFA